MEETIFIQIASYRDPELCPTILDCIANAAKPDNLHFCVGWQHGDEETLDFKALEAAKANLFIINVPYMEARGACWIRRRIQDQYNGEKYTLQLDSHHRFSKNWDTQLIKMLKGLKKAGSKKPLLTAYLPSYDPIPYPQGVANEPWYINYDRFQPEGPIFLKPSTIKDWQTLTAPVPSRGLSGHFIFTQGKFCREVPYDDQLYFHGEEISMAVRAFTHGYDLFHPHKVILWHQYTREGQKKHWDDHNTWGKSNEDSYRRFKVLFGIDGVDQTSIDFKECGFGTTRTLADFERYAGVEFKTRKFHKDVLAEIHPPIKYVDEETFQKELCHRFKHCIDIHKPSLPLKDYDNWCVVFKDKDNKDLYRKDVNEPEINVLLNSDPKDQFVHIWREFDILEKPYKWTVWPHSKSKEWETQIIESKINYL
jgi:hypothetical protein